MDYYLIVYILFSIVLIFSGVYYLFKLDKTIGAMLYGLGSIAVCVFYGIRWFDGDKLKKLGYAGSWPPHINMCPDYFTLYSDNGGTYCVDSVGFTGTKFSKPTDGTSITAIALGGSAVAPTLSQGMLIKGGESSRRIDLTTNAGLQIACQTCQALNIPWEGITDGKGYCSAKTIGGGGNLPACSS